MDNEREDTIHLWDFEQGSIFVKINSDKISDLVNRAQTKYKSAAQLYEDLFSRANRSGIRRKASRGNAHAILKSQKRALPLWMLLELVKLSSKTQKGASAELMSLEKQIIAYKDSEKGKWIEAKLPVKSTPEMAGLLAHFLGDGTFGPRCRTANYCQKSAVGRSRFVAKLESVFGKFEINQRAYDGYHVLVPTPIADALRCYYGMLQTGALKRRLPAKITLAPRMHRVAALTAFLIDEGHIGDHIEICLSNPFLLQDFRELAVGRGYECSPIRSRPGHQSKNRMYRFRISLHSAAQLLADIQELSRQYPGFDLAQKQAELEQIVSRQKRPMKKTRDGYTQDAIMEFLKSGPKTVRDLRPRLGVSGSTICEHLRKMEKKGQITENGKSGGSVIWQLS